MFESLDISTSGLIAQRIRIETSAANLAGMNARRGPNGLPYRRKFVDIATGLANDKTKPGVHVEAIKEDQAPFLRKHDPGDPDADKDGYVLLPNVDLAVEQVNSLEASRAYEANVTMMETTKAMFNSSLRLIA